MPPPLVLKGPDVQRVLRGAQRLLLELTAPQADPAIAAGQVFVRFMKEQLAQPGSGRVYTTEFRMIEVGGEMRPVPITSLPRAPHQASAPGQPPASDSGDLSDSIGVEVRSVTDREATVGVGVTAKGLHWKWLEFGTRFMRPRPFVRRAIAEGEAGATDVFLRKMRARAKRILGARRVA